MKHKTNSEDRRIKTLAKNILMIEPMLSREETRHYLAGFHVETCAAGGILIVGTDGHRMGIIHDESGEVRGEWISPVTKSFCSAAAKAGEGAVAYFCGRMAYIIPAQKAAQAKGPASAEKVATHGELIDPIDGTFPEWEKVVPRTISHRQRPVCINGRYIADFAKVAEAAGVLKRVEKSGAMFNFYQTGGSADPLIVRHPKLPEFVGIQMPVRMDQSEPLPEWLPVAA